MTIQITLGKNKTVVVKGVSNKKLTALRSLHGPKNLKLMFDYDLSNLNW